MKLRGKSRNNEEARGHSRRGRGGSRKARKLLKQDWREKTESEGKSRNVRYCRMNARWYDGKPIENQEKIKRVRELKKKRLKKDIGYTSRQQWRILRSKLLGIWSLVQNISFGSQVKKNKKKNQKERGAGYINIYIYIYEALIQVTSRIAPNVQSFPFSGTCISVVALDGLSDQEVCTATCLSYTHELASERKRGSRDGAERVG